MIPDTKYSNCELSRLYNEIATPTFLTTIREVLEMINDSEADAYFRMNANNITLEEEIMFENVFNIKDYHKYLPSSMQKNNMRFFYLSDVNFNYTHIDYCIKSRIDESKNNEFSSYFIGKLVKKCEDVTIDFVLILILQKIIRHLDKSYSINFKDLYLYCFKSKENCINSDYINACISLFHIFITLFRILDKIINLKYKDCDKVIKSIIDDDLMLDLEIHLRYGFVNIDIMQKVIIECFNFAITDNKDPGDYEIMVKKCFELLLNDKAE